MRAFAIVCFLLCAAVCPVLADTLLETAEYFEGTWTCKTDPGAFAIHNYRIELGNHWMTMHNRFEMPGGGTGQYDEYYGYFATPKQWRLVVFGSDNTIANGASSGWGGSIWQFAGEMQSGTQKTPWRMTYKRDGPTKFERVHEVQAAGQWKRVSGEVCEKR